MSVSEISLTTGFSPGFCPRVQSRPLAPPWAGLAVERPGVPLARLGYLSISTFALSLLRSLLFIVYWAHRPSIVSRVSEASDASKGGSLTRHGTLFQST